jgi:hypothetical protein
MLNPNIRKRRGFSGLVQSCYICHASVRCGLQARSQRFRPVLGSVSFFCESRLPIAFPTRFSTPCIPSIGPLAFPPLPSSSHQPGTFRTKMPAAAAHLVTQTTQELYGYTQNIWIHFAKAVLYGSVRAPGLVTEDSIYSNALFSYLVVCFIELVCVTLAAFSFRVMW